MSGRILTTVDGYSFRYQEEASPHAAISLLMPVRHEEYRHRELHFARVCKVRQPQAVIVALLETLECLLARFPEFCEQAPQVVAAIRQSASPFMQTFA